MSRKGKKSLLEYQKMLREIRPYFRDNYDGRSLNRGERSAITKRHRKLYGYRVMKTHRKGAAAGETYTVPRKGILEDVRAGTAVFKRLSKRQLRGLKKRRLLPKGQYTNRGVVIAKPKVTAKKTKEPTRVYIPADGSQIVKQIRRRTDYLIEIDPSRFIADPEESLWEIQRDYNLPDIAGYRLLIRGHEENNVRSTYAGMVDYLFGADGMLQRLEEDWEKSGGYGTDQTAAEFMSELVTGISVTVQD